MDSPFKNILHTNAVPSDADCQRIRALLVGPRKEAEELSQEIGRIQAVLDYLTRKRGHLVNFVDAHLALVSPVRRLPDDVVREIFEASLPSEYPVLCGAKSPLLLCQICRPWRRLALSTPRLWASLHVATAPSGDQQKVNDAVNVWISRSGSVPLSLSLFESPINTFYLGVSLVMKTFIRVANRWKNVRFELAPERHLAPLAVLSPDDVPMLQSAVVEYQPEPEGDPPDVSALNFLSFMGAPTLRRVSLRFIATGYDSLPLHWQTLLHLSIKVPVDVREVLAVLQQSPKLETCNLGLQLKSMEGVDSPRPCHLDHLSQLCVYGQSHVSASFFRALVLPSLRRLEYASFNVELGHSFPFLNLLSPDNCLEHLTLDLWELPAESVLEALRLVPMLQELRMTQDWMLPPANESGDPDDESGDAVNWDGLDESGYNIRGAQSVLTHVSQEPAEMLCPRLQSIHLLHASISDDGLLEFIRSRTGQLSRVHVEFDRPMQVDIMPSLQVLIDNSLNVSLHYNYHPPFVPRYHPSHGNQLPDEEWAPVSTTWTTGIL
ncbi:hypothetical protein B0H10DRAFT_2441478 [Mycena sp. CBHHK59/15]|nr:hypothetical protein B0H10DRAFT_2441478 [Mycena sp. CBHHK59/15]